jgi:hypothetical protein
MFDIMDDGVWKIAVTIVGSLLVAALLYLARVVNRFVKLIERHEKVLYGDQDIADWVGLVKISLNNREYSITSRRVLILLVSILCRNKTIELDPELKELLDLLKKD